MAVFCSVGQGRHQDIASSIPSFAFSTFTRWGSEVVFSCYHFSISTSPGGIQHINIPTSPNQLLRWVHIELASWRAQMNRRRCRRRTNSMATMASREKKAVHVHHIIISLQQGQIRGMVMVNSNFSSSHDSGRRTQSRMEMGSRWKALSTPETWPG
jgi:hypothetical protein